MKLLRRVLVRILRPLMHGLGWFTRRRQSRLEALLLRVNAIAQPGDVILTYRKRSFTGWLIPGHWDHAAVVGSYGVVIDAVYPRVREASLVRLLEGVDEVAILEPNFADTRQRGEAVRNAMRYVGKPYDLGFEPGKDAFYCSELVWHAYRLAVPSWKFDARERLGVETVTPQDLHDAKVHFRTKTYLPDGPKR